MRRAAAQVWTAGAAVEQGLDLAAQVGATAAEAVRSRRDPAAVARRRQRAARRRVRSWSAASAATVLGGAGVVAIAGGVSTGVIIALVVLAVVLTFCVARALRAAADLRARTRVVHALPPPSPRRGAVVAELRPVMARLDGYSDGLRRLVGMIGLVGDDSTVRALRGEVISSADATEQRLRARAADLSDVIRARRRAAADVGGELDVTIASMRGEIDDGVRDYGRLVTAANEAVHATRALAQGPQSASAIGVDPQRPERAVLPDPVLGPEPARVAPELGEPIDQLRALAAGMRELSGR